MDLNSIAENKAQECIDKYDFCKSLKLDFLKEKLASMLNHIGDNGMFAEYTMHDISHVNGMLNLLNKIIVDDTRYIMTDADWLMTVLAIYFHDLGMFISQKEFENRKANTEFVSFAEKKRNVESISEYLATLKTSGDDERFLYQEYVRQNHGKRICNWLTNCDKIDEEPCKLLHEMLDGLDATFRKKLALICKSHQDDELDVALHEVDFACGPTDMEKVNLLFVSVLLRAADVLHVTHDRTPDVEYRLISPRNKISIVEWTKQKSVKSIDVKKERDENGNVDNNKQPHGFSVQASFEDDNGYFSFKDYLGYADQELKRCHRWCEESRIKNGTDYKFPWDYIDTERVDAIGFCKEKLSFEIDQQNILKLLTGHTLYNDSTVVLRELVQNAIDAGKLQDNLEKKGSAYCSKVLIEWNSEDRILRISDNATGMNDEAIRNYLLKVGTSKYSSEVFKKEYPDFHSISRFGIGLLTCFMISDDVDVYTMDSDEQKCRMLKIRNLHGEYLMRDDADSSHILEKAHGTTFELKVRDDVDMTDVESQIKQWIMLPFSEVSLIIDDNSPIQIGYKTPKDAIESYSRTISGLTIDDIKYRVYTSAVGGIEMACLQKYDETSNVWTVYSYNENEYDPVAPIDICIEGIKVTATSPGIQSRHFLSIVNCVGKDSPSTNVARNELEENSRLNTMYERIYKMYMDMYVTQLKELVEQQNVSWVINEINFHINQFVNTRQKHLFTKYDILKSVIRTLDCNIIDNGTRTEIVSVEGMPHEVCTMDSMAYDSSVKLVRDMEGADVTPLGLLRSLDKQFSAEGDYLQNTSMPNVVDELFRDCYSVTSINIDQNHRRVLFTWENNADNWKTYKVDMRYMYNMKICVPKDISRVKVYGACQKSALVSGRCIYLCFNTPIQELLTRLVNAHDVKENTIKIVSSYIASFLFDEENFKDSHFNNYFESDDNYLGEKLWDNGLTKEELKNVLKQPILPIINIRNYYHEPYL